FFFALGAISVYAAMKYTMGDSAYGYRGLGDIYVFVFFGLVSVVGSYFLFAKQLDHIVLFPAIVVGLLSVGVLNLNNMKDIESDKRANKMTTAVKLGKERSKKYHLFLVISAMVVALIFAVLYYTSFWSFLFLIAYI